MTDLTHEPRPLSATRGRWLLVAAAVLWSTTGLFVKFDALRTVDGPTLACLRSLFAALCLLPFLKLESIRWRRGLVPMAVAFAAMNGLFLTAMTLTTAAAAVFLQHTATPWSFLLGLVVLGESWRRGNLVAVGLAVAGIAVIVVADNSHNSTDQTTHMHWMGNLMAGGSGLAFAIVIVSLRHLRDLSPVFLVLVNQLAACLVLLPWLAWHPPELSLQQWTLLAIFGVVQMAVPYLLFARGVKSVPIQEAALIVLLEPVLTPTWVGLLGWESAPATVWLGGGLIVTGLLLRYTLFAKDSQNDRTPIGDS